ncbi:MAG: recombinase family protein [Clostridium sp.]|nr:recombinase family protein [Clostridium sp.]
MRKQPVTALYLRVSDEDGIPGIPGAARESGSIAGQRLLLREFVKGHEDLSGHPVIEVTDDGYSGTDFDRPGIRSLLRMAQDAAISCIVVKDFSRFGRNYLEVGNYLEQVFPLLGVRFLSVNDQFDSFRDTAAGSVEVGFRNLIYEAYSRDLSIKVKSALREKARQGKFVAAFAPFGYRKAARERNRLVADPECAPVVRRIFRFYADGMAQTEIAGLLNREAVPSPLMVRRKRGENFPGKPRGETAAWTAGTVAHILSDRRYTGEAIYGKVTPLAVGSRKGLAVPEEDWIVVPDAHEAILSREEFEAAQSRKKKYRVRGRAAMAGKNARGLP